MDDYKKYYFDNIGYDEEAYNTINEYFNGIKKESLIGKVLRWVRIKMVKIKWLS